MWYVVTHGRAAEQLGAGELLSGLCAPVEWQGPTRRCGALAGLDLPVPGRKSSIVDAMPPNTRKRVRLDLDLLDIEDPFEIDGGNRVHMIKHLLSDDAGKPVAVGPEDVLDLYLYGDPDYYPAKEDGPADWLMIGMVPGLLLCVPLAPPNSGNARFCRPIGIYSPSMKDRNRYLGGPSNE